MKAICSVDGCSNYVHAKGVCGKHYQRLLSVGSVDDSALSRNPKNTLHDWLHTAINYTGNDCLAWPFTKHSNGYGNVTFGGVSKLPHRIVCQAAHGECPSERHEVAHSCGNRSCCNPHHLRWATRAENVLDKFKHGTVKRGRNHPHAKLCENDVVIIKQAIGKTGAQLAREFGVSFQTISEIRLGKTWKHVFAGEAF